MKLKEGLIENGFIVLMNAGTKINRENHTSANIVGKSLNQKQIGRHIVQGSALIKTIRTGITTILMGELQNRNLVEYGLVNAKYVVIGLVIKERSNTVQKNVVRNQKELNQKKYMDQTKKVNHNMSAKNVGYYL